MLHLDTLRLDTLRAPVTARVSRWSERAQRRAQTNARVASRALREARRERTEVEAYVVGTLARRDAAPAAAPVGEGRTGS